MCLGLAPEHVARVQRETLAVGFGVDLACASCHPEGHDDGQVWNFSALGPRRTQSLAGGIAGTEPFSASTCE